MKRNPYFDIKWNVILLASAACLYFAGNAGWSYPRLPIKAPVITQVKPDQAAVNNTLSQIKPFSTTISTSTRPAPANPILTWTKVPGAVLYEVEITSAPPENPNGIAPSRYQLATSRQVFTTGYNPELSSFGKSKLFWRVRALDYDENPIGVYSDATELVITPNNRQTIKPIITATFNENDMPTPLYPVYAWVPIAGATHYEVEILDSPPENPNGVAPSSHRIDSGLAEGFDYYDVLPRVKPGVYYWRVRGLDAAGNSVGVFSDDSHFTVSPQSSHYAATFGDSITHGGGAISYSPADIEYDYQTYLRFPAVNLGHSGDTTADMVERFQRDVLPFHPQFLLIMGGTNSIRGGTLASDVIDDLQTIAELCHDNNIRPIFLTLPPINPDNIEKAFQQQTAPQWRKSLTLVNDFIRHQPYFIDIAPALTGDDGLLPTKLAIDGLHFDIAGKQRMAEVINAKWDRVTH